MPSLSGLILALLQHADIDELQILFRDADHDSYYPGTKVPLVLMNEPFPIEAVS